MRHPVKSMRTAPLGTGFLGIFGFEIILNASELRTDNTAIMAIGALATAVEVTGLGLGGALIRRQISLKQRLEDSIERHGYEERIFAQTTDEWCTRQTARVVAEDNGVLDQYKELCEQRTSTAQLAFLPHI